MGENSGQMGGVEAGVVSCPYSWGSGSSVRPLYRMGYLP